jgi:hypothetical protein
MDEVSYALVKALVDVLLLIAGKCRTLLDEVFSL